MPSYYRIPCGTPDAIKVAFAIFTKSTGGILPPGVEIVESGAGLVPFCDNEQIGGASMSLMGVNVTTRTYKRLGNRDGMAPAASLTPETPYFSVLSFGCGWILDGMSRALDLMILVGASADIFIHKTQSDIGTEGDMRLVYANPLLTIAGRQHLINSNGTGAPLSALETVLDVHRDNNVAAIRLVGDAEGTFRWAYVRVDHITPESVYICPPGARGGVYNVTDSFPLDSLVPLAANNSADRTSYYWNPYRKTVLKLNNTVGAAVLGPAATQPTGFVDVYGCPGVKVTIARVYSVPHRCIRHEILVTGDGIPTGHADIVDRHRRRLLTLGNDVVTDTAAMVAGVTVEPGAGEWNLAHPADNSRTAITVRLFAGQLFAHAICANHGQFAPPSILECFSYLADSSSYPLFAVQNAGTETFPDGTLKPDLMQLARLGITGYPFATANHGELMLFCLPRTANHPDCFTTPVGGYVIRCDATCPENISGAPHIVEVPPGADLEQAYAEVQTRFIRDPYTNGGHPAERRASILTMLRPHVRCTDTAGIWSAIDRLVPECEPAVFDSIKILRYSGEIYMWHSDWPVPADIHLRPERVAAFSSIIDENTHASVNVPSCFMVKQTICAVCGTNCGIADTYQNMAIHLAGQGMREGAICGRCRSMGAETVGAWTRPGLLGRAIGYRMCEDCSGMFHQTMMSSHPGVCQECYTENFGECCECGGMFRHNRLTDGTCQSCRQNIGSIHEYSYRPRLVFHKLDKEALFFGVEIELESVDADNQDSLKESVSEVLCYPGCKNFMFAKRDGSLASGAEFVSQPFSWEWFMANQPRFEDIFARMQDNGFRARRTCGLHIHVSRQPHSQLEEFRTHQLLYGNPAEWEKLSLRVQNGAGFRYCHLRSEYTHPRERVRVARQRGYYKNRYVALNPTNRETIEWRLWAGVQTLVDFGSALALTAASHAFARSGALGVRPSFEKFKSFLNNHSEFGPRAASRLATAGV